MDKHRIKMSDIVIGQPLPWNVCDADNKLLLRKGQIVTSEGQIDKLIERGLFVEAQSKKEADEPPPKELPSALRHVNRAGRQLERLFLNLSNEADAPAQFSEIAREMVQAIALNADVCVASIFLNQGNASLPVRHCINTAILSYLVARALARPAQEIDAIVAAALTMNLGLIPHQKRLTRIQAGLSQEDAVLVRNHPLRSVELLRQAGVADESWLSFVGAHHESEDGSGFPAKAVGADIPLGAKILSTVERYCLRVSAGEPAALWTPRWRAPCSRNWAPIRWAASCAWKTGRSPSFRPRGTRRARPWCMSWWGAAMRRAPFRSSAIRRSRLIPYKRRCVWIRSISASACSRSGAMTPPREADGQAR